mgnify:CR=1 FL=1
MTSPPPRARPSAPAPSPGAGERTPRNTAAGMQTRMESFRDANLGVQRARYARAEEARRCHDDDEYMAMDV